MKSNLIFDIGAYKGEDTEYYLRKGFVVVAVEAIPGLASVIRHKFSNEIESGLLAVVNAAVNVSSDQTPFYIYEYGQWSSLYHQRPGWSSKIIVDSILPIELFNKYGIPYYLKIDIEGSDILVIRALSEIGRADLPKYVSFEIGKDVIEAINILSDLGYNRYKLIEQSAVHKIRVPFPPTEGQFIEYTFSTANSGPFGEETPGVWKPLQVARSEIERIDWETTVEVFGNEWKVWYDIHVAI